MLVQIEIPDQPTRYSEPAAHVVRELAEKGVRLTLDDLEWLHQLGDRLTNGPNADALARGIPARAGNVWLWPWTLAAAAWYEWAIKNLELGPLDLYVPAFALACGRIDGTFDKLYDPISALDAVDTWRKTTYTTMGELSRAILKVDPNIDLSVELEDDKDKDDDKDHSRSILDMTATVVACCGGDPGMWETKVSKNYLLRQLDAVMTQRKAETGDDSMDAEMMAAEKEIARAQVFLERRGETDG